MMRGFFGSLRVLLPNHLFLEADAKMASNTGAPAAQASASYQMDSKDIERVVTGTAAKMRI